MDVVLHRFLSYAQLYRLASTHPTATRRRIRALAQRRWLTLWDQPLPHGGRQRYALPAPRTLRMVLATLEHAAAGAPHEPLVRCMLPQTRRKPLELVPGATPKWLAHQREVNHLVTSIRRSTRRLLWASSWDCPFPATAGILSLPQPDYVLVEEVDGVPRLVFGEHDRGTEPIARFVKRKAELYGALAAFPEVCEQQFGLRSFDVHVTVCDPLHLAPIARLRALATATLRAGVAERFRFALGGWLFAFPTERIWFKADQPPESESVRREDHRELLAA